LHSPQRTALLALAVILTVVCISCAGGSSLHNVSQVPASAFEVVQMSPVYTSGNVPQGSAPTISSFSASASNVATGTTVILSRQASGASYLVISPQFGALRGSSVQVAPSQTTSYTLYATNQYGRATATVSVTVH